MTAIALAVFLNHFFVVLDHDTYAAIDANAFLDWGGAFDKLDFKKIEFFKEGAIIDSPQLHTSVGLELWFAWTLGYGLGTNIRIGWAHGFSQEAYKPGQLYLVASSQF